MKPTEISYMKRKNLGNYEHEEVKITAVLDEDENAGAGIEELKVMVDQALGDNTAPAVTTTKTGKDKKAGKKDAKPEVVEAEEVEEEEIEAAEVEEETEEEEVVETKKPAKAGKKSGSVYSRANETHKALMVEQLTKLFPKWKKTDAGKAKAKAVSKSLDGEQFLDADGDIVNSFILALKKGMK